MVSRYLQLFVQNERESNLTNAQHHIIMSKYYIIFNDYNTIKVHITCLQMERRPKGKAKSGIVQIAEYYHNFKFVERKVSVIDLILLYVHLFC